MFKIYPPTFFVVPIAWLTILMVLGLNAVEPFLLSYGITPRLSWIVLVVQLIVTLVIVTPAWRWLWGVCPKLNRWVYPDLNGEWDVHGETNWPRIDATLSAAGGQGAPLDMRNAPEATLPPLGTTLMRARIKQTWLTMRMDLWNPSGSGPIHESKTLSVDPYRGEDGRHGLYYIFQQENSSPVVTDDRVFFGAVRLVLDKDSHDILCGRMWSDRMWRRGMNTAADVTFVRAE